MSTRQISDAVGVWGQTAQAEQKLLTVEATVALQHGDVVIWDGANGTNVTTTTTANSALVAGVVSVTGDASTNAGTVAAGAPVDICIGGVARVNIGSQTVAASGVLGTFTTAKQADDTATAIGTNFGIALESQAAKDANNCILAKITL